MRVYFSGIGGVGIGPLAEIAHDKGYDVIGSDVAASPLTRQLETHEIAVYIGQDGSQISRAHEHEPIDWFVYTSALPANHPELIYAIEHGIRTSKRDEFLATLLKEKGLKLIAVAGTHGKTTTTGMLMFAMKQLGIPLSYSIGTTISWGPSGKFDPASEYFVYECDEYDRNFLHYEPHISIITALDYDHVDTYPTVKDYQDAFKSFLQQSAFSLMWQKDLQYLQTDPSANLETFDEHMDLSHITLAGLHVRQNAFLVQKVLERIVSESANHAENESAAIQRAILEAINAFPGTSRRFEKLADNLYSDYGHHPSEIAVTLQMAKELSDHIVLVYQPHQNIRQHEIREQYTDAVFANADEIYWLPTYLSREDPSLETLTPAQLTANITPEKIRIVSMDHELWQAISQHRSSGHLVLVMGAGSVEQWLRQQLTN